ncbi:hypothetical protein Patl1_13688 [Pistacia atlantica]|uniref:Uncharacterized protein n=1 Tax=Pistacia atlantica TaxID=434234 RepID=A0ACC1AUJ1_9ROSI|nr:hypothetical protein Patl1_13688 [Pistacia atlantica]
MMDEYLDQYLSSSSWSDANAKERSTLDYCERQNGLLPISVELYEDDEKNSPASIISANHTIESLADHDLSSIVLGEESDYSVDKNLLSEDAQAQKDYENCNGNLSSKMNGSLKLGNVGLRYDTAIPGLGSVNPSYPNKLPVVSHISSSDLSFTQLGHLGGNGSELSDIQRSVRDLQTLSPIPGFWFPSSYKEVSSLSHVMGQDRIECFGLQAANINNDIDTTRTRYVGMEKILQFDSLPASVTPKGKQELQNHPLSSFAAAPQTMMPSPQQQLKMSEGSPVKYFTNKLSTSLYRQYQLLPTGSFNGTGKPRARARRGQATDPHSIAERLRREKIAERMKNLQELVPNSNKTDKASMLDEIIDYVKFLQLQVKVLSVSRLGAAGAVLPLITDGQAEGSTGLSVSPPAGKGVDISMNPDQVAFEEEVVKLMETNVTMAMQYLQTKGLCLMPIALATAISSGKASSSSISVSDEWKKIGFSNGVAQNNSSSSSSSNNSLASDSNIITGKPVREAVMINGCNGAVKQMRNTFCTAAELKPKT